MVLADAPHHRRRQLDGLCIASNRQLEPVSAAVFAVPAAVGREVEADVGGRVDARADLLVNPSFLVREICRTDADPHVLVVLAAGAHGGDRGGHAELLKE